MPRGPVRTADHLKLTNQLSWGGRIGSRWRVKGIIALHLVGRCIAEFQLEKLHLALWGLPLMGWVVAFLYLSGCACEQTWKSLVCSTSGANDVGWQVCLRVDPAVVEMELDSNGHGMMDLAPFTAETVGCVGEVVKGQCCGGSSHMSCVWGRALAWSWTWRGCTALGDSLWWVLR